MKFENSKIPYHVKGSKPYYKNCKGTKFIFEEVIHPGELNDSDFVNKKLLMKNLQEIAKQTMREELIKAVDKYIKRASIMYIISDLNHNVIGLSISEVSLENGIYSILPWLNMYRDEYRENGFLKICVTKATIHCIKEYQKVKGFNGIKFLIPLFKRWFFAYRTFNPIIYYSLLRTQVKVSPLFDRNGMIKKISISKDERRVRIDFLKKLGYKEDKINNTSLFIVKSLYNEKENEKMYNEIQKVPSDNVNKFFKNHLGLNDGNLLIATASFRPITAVPISLFIRLFKTTTRSLKKNTKKILLFPDSGTVTANSAVSTE